MSFLKRHEARSSFTLAGNETMQVPRPPATRLVRVERGLVLVTREGDPEDHVLSPGMELALPRRGRTVAWALTPARLRVA